MKYGVKAKQYTYEEALKVKDNPILKLQGLKKKWAKDSKMLDKAEASKNLRRDTQRWLQQRAEKSLMNFKDQKKKEINDENEPPDQEFMFFLSDGDGKKKSFNFDSLSTDVPTNEPKISALRRVKPRKQ